MTKKNDKLYFENREEKENFSKIIKYINSFYMTKKGLKRFLNNMRYFRNAERNTYAQCFKDEVQGILYLLPLEFPELETEYLNYLGNKEHNVLEFAITQSCNMILKALKQENMI